MEFHTVDDLFASLSLDEIRSALAKTRSESAASRERLQGLLGSRYTELLATVEEAQAMLESVATVQDSLSVAAEESSVVLDQRSDIMRQSQQDAVPAATALSDTEGLPSVEWTLLHALPAAVWDAIDTDNLLDAAILLQFGRLAVEECFRAASGRLHPLRRVVLERCDSVLQQTDCAHTVRDAFAAQILLSSSGAREVAGRWMRAASLAVDQAANEVEGVGGEETKRDEEEKEGDGAQEDGEAHRSWRRLAAAAGAVGRVLRLCQGLLGHDDGEEEENRGETLASIDTYVQSRLQHIQALWEGTSNIPDHCVGPALERLLERQIGGSESLSSSSLGTALQQALSEEVEAPIARLGPWVHSAVEAVSADRRASKLLDRWLVALQEDLVGSHTKDSKSSNDPTTGQSRPPRTPWHPVRVWAEHCEAPLRQLWLASAQQAVPELPREVARVVEEELKRVCQVVVNAARCGASPPCTDTMTTMVAHSAVAPAFLGEGRHAKMQSSPWYGWDVSLKRGRGPTTLRATSAHQSVPAYHRATSSSELLQWLAPHTCSRSHVRSDEGPRDLLHPPLELDNGSELHPWSTDPAWRRRLRYLPLLYVHGMTSSAILAGGWMGSLDRVERRYARLATIFRQPDLQPVHDRWQALGKALQGALTPIVQRVLQLEPGTDRTCLAVASRMVEALARQSPLPAVRENLLGFARDLTVAWAVATAGQLAEEWAEGLCRVQWNQSPSTGELRDDAPPMWVDIPLDDGGEGDDDEEEGHGEEEVLTVPATPSSPTRHLVMSLEAELQCAGWLPHAMAGRLVQDHSADLLQTVRQLVGAAQDETDGSDNVAVSRRVQELEHLLDPLLEGGVTPVSVSGEAQPSVLDSWARDVFLESVGVAVRHAARRWWGNASTWASMRAKVAEEAEDGVSLEEGRHAWDAVGGVVGQFVGSNVREHLVDNAPEASETGLHHWILDLYTMERILGSWEERRAGDSSWQSPTSARGRGGGSGESGHDVSLHRLWEPFQDPSPSAAWRTSNDLLCLLRRDGWVGRADTPSPAAPGWSQLVEAASNALDPIDWTLLEEPLGELAAAFVEETGVPLAPDRAANSTLYRAAMRGQQWKERTKSARQRLHGTQPMVVPARIPLLPVPSLRPSAWEGGDAGGISEGHPAGQSPTHPSPDRHHHHHPNQQRSEWSGENGAVPSSYAAEGGVSASWRQWGSGLWGGQGADGTARWGAADLLAAVSRQRSGDSK